MPTSPVTLLAVPVTTRWRTLRHTVMFSVLNHCLITSPSLAERIGIFWMCVFCLARSQTGRALCEFSPWLTKRLSRSGIKSHSKAHNSFQHDFSFLSRNERTYPRGVDRTCACCAIHARLPPCRGHTPERCSVHRSTSCDLLTILQTSSACLRPRSRLIPSA